MTVVQEPVSLPSATTKRSRQSSMTSALGVAVPHMPWETDDAGTTPTDAAGSGAGSSSLPPLATLKCCLCKDYLKTPVTLPCLHTGCHSCFLKEAGPFSPIPEGSTKKAPPAFFSCPVCIEDATVPRDPSAIATDNRVTRLIKLVQETRHLCDNCGELAEVECNVCVSSMCSGCFSTTHSAPVFKTHEAKALKSAKLAQLSPCGIHGSEMEFWCDTCEMSVCQVCLLKGAHKGHKFTPVRDVRNAAYESIKLKMKAAGIFKAQMESSKAQVEAEMETLNKQYDTVCVEINSNFEKIEEAIKLRKQALLKDAEGLKGSKETTLRQQRDSIASAISNVGEAIETTWGLVKYSNDHEIVERQSIMEARLEKMTLQGKLQEPVESGNLSVALFNHMGAAVAGYGAVRGTAVAAATAHKHQLEKLVSEADRILSNRTKSIAPDGTMYSPPPKGATATAASDTNGMPADAAKQAAVVDDGSYCAIM